MAENESIFKQIVEALYDSNVDSVLELVQDNDFDINFRDVTHDLQTLLMRTCYMQLDTSGLQLVFEAFFEKGPDVNIQDSWGRTVLMHACIANKPAIIEGLLEYEPTNVSVIDFEGNSALSYALHNSDIYTLEDILVHPAGPKLLDVHNAKGQSPYQQAQAGRDTAIQRLFESYKSQSLGRQKRNRKPRHRDVIQLPTVSYSPPREVQPLRLVPPGKETVSGKKSIAYNTSHHSKSASTPRMRENLLTLKLTSKIGGHSDEKCDSAPVRRSNHFFDREHMASSLPLSSPRLERRCHKQNCLRTETNKRNTCETQFPPMKNNNIEGELLDIECAGYFRKQRRGSISLPDLRDVSGYLVTSGASTPTTGSGLNSPDSRTSDEDDVFAQSYPKISSSQNSTTHKKKLNILERQCTLPEINSGMVTRTDPGYSLGLSPLARQRKYSTSDDQIHRPTVRQDAR